MLQTILVGIIFAIALVYLGRFLFRQMSPKQNVGKCEKCLPKEVADKKMTGKATK